MSLKYIKHIEAYTDGSCIRGHGDVRCGYGVHFSNPDITDISRPFRKSPLMNQRAELYAIYRAIRHSVRHYRFDKLTIYSDSMYSIRSLTEWIDNWKTNGWKTYNGKPVQNSDLIRQIDRYVTKYRNKLEFIHVRAHTGGRDRDSVNNAMADELARKGAIRN